MSTSSPIRGRRIWIALSILLAACGGGTSQTASTNPTTIEGTIEATTTDSSATDGDAAAETSDAVDATTAPATTTPAAAEPDNFAKLSDWENWQPAAFDVAPPSDPDDITAQLGAMYDDLIALWTADRRIASMALTSAFDRYDDTPPAGHIEALGTEATILADSFALIAAHSAANAAGAGAVFFERRAAGYDLLAGFQQELHHAISEFVDADSVEQLCFVQALADRCDDGRAGEVADQLFDRSDELRDQYDDLDIDDADSDLPRPALTVDGPPVSFNCAAWYGAVEANGLSERQQFDIFVAIDDTLIDTRIIGLSECEWESDREEDPVIPEGRDGDALRHYVEAIVNAAATAGFTSDEFNEAYDAENADSLIDPARAAIMPAATRAAADVWQSVTDPFLASRLFLVSWSSDWDPFDREELDWDDAADDVCAAYEASRDALDAPTAESVHLTIRYLELDDLLIPDSCDSPRESDDAG